MNKFVVLLIVIIIGIAAYVKLNEPAIPASSDKQPKDSISIEADQQALPDSAKGLVDEIKSGYENENAYHMKKSGEAEHKEIEKRIKEHEKSLVKEEEESKKYERKPVDEIPIELGTSGFSLRWPCKTATFAQIVDSYGKVWGSSSIAPHDKPWYNAIANGLTDYAACRTITSNDIAVCDRLLIMGNDRNEFIDTYRSCMENTSYFYATLFSVEKGKRSLCDSFRIPFNVELCSLIREKRGHELCDSIENITEEYKKFCLAYFPASESDCSSVGSVELREKCVNNYKLYQALKYDNVRLCPSGRLGVVCAAYFVKDNAQSCDVHMQRLTKNFCSGGKYSNSRVPRLK